MPLSARAKAVKRLYPGFSFGQIDDGWSFCLGQVHHGKHHTQAVCTCATHLLDRIWTILKENRPYELRDVDGTPVTTEQARQIITERYTVTPELRKRNNQRTRRERRERLAEKKLKRESAPIKVRGES